MALAPPCPASEILRSEGIEFKRIVASQPDAILYLDEKDKPHTAFVSEFGGQAIVITTEEGFPVCLS